MDINLDIPSDEKEVINQAMLLDDQVDTNLDTPLENLMDTNEVISMVDQSGIKPEMLLDINVDTVLDTDDASTSESLKLGYPVIQNLLDEDDIDEIFS